uniref:TIGR03943 family putative permease subunit n=1 Tax=Candidatus Fimenecus sp. TaxID=3022888 RepID=UPI003FF07CDF
VKIIKIEDEEIITPEYLQGLEKEIGFERVVIEYNGMWLIDDLYQKLPVNWVVYQEMAFADARTFLTYNNNMRNLTVDKMKSPEVIIFKHFDRSMDKMDYHKIVRVINRRCQIIYEYAKDQIEFDDIEDPLPYDIEVPLVEIEDQNYAIWYTDINEEEDKYYGKTLKIKGRSLLGGGLDDDEFVIGRHIMTCCVEDIQFGGLVAKYDRAEELEHGEWVEMTAVVKKEFNHMYQSEGPVLYAVSVKQTEPPEEEVATFY